MIGAGGASKPDLLSARRVLCIQPHYDDNDIGAAGTLALLHDQGSELIYLTVTDDLVGVVDPDIPDEQAAEQLESEQLAAGEVIGVDQHVWLGFPDAGPIDYYELRREIIVQVRRLRPDFLLTCDPWLPYEAHRDHVLTGVAVSEAAILHNMPRLKADPEIDRDYEPFNLSGVAYYLTHFPNTTVDISVTYRRKRGALGCYQAQFTPRDMARLQETVEAEARAVGEQAGCRYGERFKILRPEQLHLDVHAWRA